MHLPCRPADSNKSTFGSVLNIAGSVHFRGAAYLSTISALRVGAGYATLAAIPPVIDAVAAKLSEAIFLPLPQDGATISRDAVFTLSSQIKSGTICSFGCGISALQNASVNLSETTDELLNIFIQKRTPLVLDADGLNLLAKSPISFRFGNRCVMTPHPMELARLLHTDVEQIQKNRLDAAREASKKYEAIVLLKGHRTVIALGEHGEINETGNSALAKAGSGDCLTGVIAGLLAQKMEPFDAAVLGAHIHGLAGEMASKDFSEYGVLASDLPSYIARIIRDLK